MTTVLAFLIAILLAPPAWSQGAEDLLKEAELNFKMARFQRSQKLLRKAAKRATDPRILGKILLYRGLNYAVLGKRSRAKRSFRAALAHDPTLELQEGHVKPSVVDLFRKVQQRMKGQLQVTADQDLAEVHVDNEPAGTAPATLDLRIGTHQLKVVTTDGRWLYERTVVIHLSGLTKVDARLERVASPAPLVAIQPLSEASPASQPGSVGQPTPAAGKGLRIASWVLIGVGAGGLIAGAVLAGLVSAKNSEYQEAVDEGRPWEELQQIADSAKQLETGQYIAFGVGGGAAAVGVSLLIWSLLSDSPEEPTRDVSWSIQPLVDPGGGGLTGLCRF